MLAGFFDHASRAIVRATVVGPTGSATLHFEIDTGSQPQICIEQDWAEQLGIRTTAGHRATFADGQVRSVLAGTARIQWFDQEIDVDVVVWPREQGVEPAQKKAGKYRGHPDGLIGRSLMASNAILIDYLNRRVEITEPAPAGA